MKELDLKTLRIIHEQSYVYTAYNIFISSLFYLNLHFLSVLTMNGTTCTNRQRRYIRKDNKFNFNSLLFIFRLI